VQDDQDRHGLDSTRTGSSEKLPTVSKNEQIKQPRDSVQSPSCSTGLPVNPTTSPDWHLRFTIPDMGSFFKSLQVVITTRVITDRARKKNYMSSANIHNEVHILSIPSSVHSSLPTADY